MLCIIALISATPMWWSIQSAWIRLHQPNPQSPWETEILMDGWRASHGLQVYYFVSENDHASHMYGALTTYSVAVIFKIIGGFNVHAARWISVLSGVALLAILLWNFARRTGPLFIFIAATMLMTTFYRSRGYFSEGRPDVISILISVIALWMFYRAFAQHAAWIIPGTATMIVAFFYKQPASSISIIPFLSLLILRPKPFIRNLAIASIPPAAVVITLLSLKFLAPRMYFFMITGPKLFDMHWHQLPEATINLLTTDTLFVLTFVLWMLGIAKSSISPRATTWLLITCLVQALSTAAARIKDGGQVNGYLPSYIALSVFAICMLPSMLEKIAAISRFSWQRYTLAALIGCLIFADTTSIANHARWALEDNMYGDHSYKKIVRRAHQLHGKVISPDDPTIALQAKGYVGRSISSELDALGRRAFPPYLAGELASANYLIRVGGVWTSQVPLDLLRQQGYVEIKDQTFAKTQYSLWQRKRNLHPTSSRSHS